jgi:hypothetical protein
VRSDSSLTHFWDRDFWAGDAGNEGQNLGRAGRQGEEIITAPVCFLVRTHREAVVVWGRGSR